jgi:hypothetical protein
MRTPCRWVAASLPAAALADQGQIRGIAGVNKAPFPAGAPGS